MNLDFAGILSAEQLCEAFKHFPPSLVSINLKENKLKNSLAKLLLALPLNVQTIQIEEGDVNVYKFRILTKINDEINRLAPSKSNSGNIMVTLGLTKASDELIKVLGGFKAILENSADKTMKEIHHDILQWKKKNELLINQTQNGCSSFFAKDKRSRTGQVVDDVFLLLEVDEDVSKELTI